MLKKRDKKLVKISIITVPLCLILTGVFYDKPPIPTILFIIAVIFGLIFLVYLSLAFDEISPKTSTNNNDNSLTLALLYLFNRK